MFMQTMMVIAGVLIGAMVPEWIFILSNHNKLKRVPAVHNILSAIAFGIIFKFIAI